MDSRSESVAQPLSTPSLPTKQAPHRRWPVRTLVSAGAAVVALLCFLLYLDASDAKASVRRGEQSVRDAEARLSQAAERETRLRDDLSKAVLAGAAEKDRRQRAEQEVRSVRGVLKFLAENLVGSGSAAASATHRLPAHASAVNPTFREVLSGAAERVGVRFADEPAVEGSLRALLGAGYRQLGALDDAEDQLGRAYSMLRERVGETSLETILAGHERAKLALTRQRSEEARLLLMRLLDGLDRGGNSEHPAVVAVSRTLGRALVSLGDWSAARPVLERVLAIQREALGDRHRETTEIMGELAGVLLRLEDLETAEPMLASALAADLELRGNTSLGAVRAMVLTARLKVAKTEFEDAAVLLGDVLTHAPDTLGLPADEHIEAARLLGVTRREGGESLRAVEAFEAALELARSRLLDSSEVTQRVLADLAAAYSASDRPDDARDVWLDLLEIHRSEYGEAAEQTVRSFHQLGRVFQVLEEPDRSLSALNKALEGAVSLYGVAGRMTLDVATELVAVQIEVGRFQPALDVLQPLLEHGAKVWPPESEEYARLQLHAGIANRGTGDSDKAIDFLTAAYPTLVQVLGAKHETTQACVKECAAVFDARGDLESARAWRDRVIE